MDAAGLRSNSAGGSAFPAPSRAKTFVVWSNQGGVGKSTLTFNIACEYARQFPERNVLVLDMCPRAHCSSLLLGGDKKGLIKVLELCRPNANERKTIASLLIGALSNGFKQDKKELYDPFLLIPSKYNKEVAPRVRLICGDPLLDGCAPRLEDFSQRSNPQNEETPFLRVFSFIRRFIDIVTSEDPTKWVVFLDTNPTFSVLTRMALCAADQLIIPGNTDQFSVNTMQNSIRLLYGFPKSADKSQQRFFEKAGKHNLRPPRLRLILANRFVHPDAEDAPLYDAILVEMYRTVSQALKGLPKSPFLEPVVVPVQGATTELNGSTVSQQDFLNYYVARVPLLHGAGIVSNMHGQPLTNMRTGISQVGDKTGLVGPTLLLPLGWAIQDIVMHLESSYSGKVMQTAVASNSTFCSRIRLEPKYQQLPSACFEQLSLEAQAIGDDEFTPDSLSSDGDSVERDLNRHNDVEAVVVKSDPDGPMIKQDLGPLCSCRSHVAGTIMVNCDGCREWLHMTCLGLTEKDVNEHGFVCPLCKIHTPAFQPELKDQEDSQSAYIKGAERLHRKRLRLISQNGGELAILGSDLLLPSVSQYFDALVQKHFGIKQSFQLWDNQGTPCTFPQIIERLKETEENEVVLAVVRYDKPDVDYENVAFTRQLRLSCGGFPDLHMFSLPPNTGSFAELVQLHFALGENKFTMQDKTGDRWSFDDIAQWFTSEKKGGSKYGQLGLTIIPIESFLRVPLPTLEERTTLRPDEALQKLIDNSIQWTRTVRDKRLVVRWSETPTGYLSILDNGVGMTEAEVKEWMSMGNIRAERSTVDHSALRKTVLPAGETVLSPQFEDMYGVLSSYGPGINQAVSNLVRVGGQFHIKTYRGAGNPIHVIYTLGSWHTTIERPSTLSEAESAQGTFTEYRVTNVDFPIFYCGYPAAEFEIRLRKELANTYYMYLIGPTKYSRRLYELNKAVELRKPAPAWTPQRDPNSVQIVLQDKLVDPFDCFMHRCLAAAACAKSFRVQFSGGETSDGKRQLYEVNTTLLYFLSETIFEDNFGTASSPVPSFDPCISNPPSSQRLFVIWNGKFMPQERGIFDFSELGMRPKGWDHKAEQNTFGRIVILQHFSRSFNPSANKDSMGAFMFEKSIPALALKIKHMPFHEDIYQFISNCQIIDDQPRIIEKGDQAVGVAAFGAVIRFAEEKSFYTVRCVYKRKSFAISFCRLARGDSKYTCKILYPSLAGDIVHDGVIWKALDIETNSILGIAPCGAPSALGDVTPTALSIEPLPRDSNVANRVSFKITLLNHAHQNIFQVPLPSEMKFYFFNLGEPYFPQLFINKTVPLQWDDKDKHWLANLVTRPSLGVKVEVTMPQPIPSLDRTSWQFLVDPSITSPYSTLVPPSSLVNKLTGTPENRSIDPMDRTGILVTLGVEATSHQFRGECILKSDQTDFEVEYPIRSNKIFSRQGFAHQVQLDRGRAGIRNGTTHLVVVEPSDFQGLDMSEINRKRMLEAIIADLHVRQKRKRDDVPVAKNSNVPTGSDEDDESRAKRYKTE